MKQNRGEQCLYSFLKVEDDERGGGAMAAGPALVLQAPDRGAGVVDSAHGHSVHPDLLGRLPDNVRAENQSSMQELESLLAQKPSEAINLRFHVVSEDRESVASIASATFRGSLSDQAWRKQLDVGLSALLRDVVVPELLPEHVRARKLAEETEKEAIAMGMFWREPIYKDGFSSSSSQAISRLIDRDRVRCSETVDLDDGLEFAMDTLRLLDLKTLRTLETALMGDIVLNIAALDAKTFYKGQLIQLSLRLSPERAARYVTDVVDHFVMVHEESMRA
ncbi:Hypothetical Protein FCC1311_042472 [Hondaea fermentalgiana]|uniref:Uncharacterized protein n=1 Tax=Hondaea fermentalgiana TaxID=2315210 RepID=A0A2R5GJI7_9STRA|nr:Hypothetical Protein FCC1311_042472 [Hondaea fermentalgiana]|eukprot:GBG28024.1 Hypothetical Protein FCC1311_042472 [Hondaea fermentalgiana]